MSCAPTEITLDFLAARVRRLGNLLGRVIAELSGPRVFELVEYARSLAKGSRAGNANAAHQLLDAIAIYRSPKRSKWPWPSPRTSNW
jgi:phosphoenolpyruvate carboxylase